MILEYKVKGQGTIKREVKDVNDAQLYFAGHRDGLQREDINLCDFGSSELLTNPTITQGGKFVAELSYNGRVWTREDAMAKILGCTADQVRNQLKKNALQLRTMQKDALRTRRTVNGFTAKNLGALARSFEERTV